MHTGTFSIYRHNRYMHKHKYKKVNDESIALGKNRYRYNNIHRLYPTHAMCIIRQEVLGTTFNRKYVI